MEIEMQRKLLEDCIMGDTIGTDEKKIILELISELWEAVGCDQRHPAHRLDVFGHTLQVVEGVNKDIKLRLAALLHDIGKTISSTKEIYVKDGIKTKKEIRKFKGHNVPSCDMARKILTRFEYESDFIKYVCKLIYHHDDGILAKEDIEEYERRETLSESEKDALHNRLKDKVKDYMQFMGEDLFPLLLNHQEADLEAHSIDYCIKKEGALELVKSLYDEIIMENEVKGDLEIQIN